MTWNKYTGKIRTLIIDFGRRGLIEAFPIKFQLVKNAGNIYTENPHLQFRDGSYLKVFERISLVSKQVQVDNYSYHYQRKGGYFFRYDKELSDDVVRKPEHHLQVILDIPHYDSCPMNLQKILQLIEINFYSPLYSGTIVGQQIRMTV